MDKKNTMLLTVIAVATLLVAVVGATFAYFAISTTGTDTAKSTVTGKTEAVASTIAFSSGASNLTLELTADLMAKSVSQTADVPYYAEATGQALKYSLTPKNHKLFIAKVSGEEGSATATYKCTGTLKVVGSGTLLEENESLTDKDGKVTVNGAGLTTEDITLVALKDASTNGVTKSVTFTITGSEEAALTGDVSVVNLKETEQQEYLAGKTLNVTFSLESVTCDTAAAPGA